MNLDVVLINPEDVAFLIVILFLTFLGSLSKDYINLFNNGIRINFKRIMLSTLTASIFTFAFTPIIIYKTGFRGLIVISYMFGIIGFELLQRISTYEGLVDIISRIMLILDSLRSSILFMNGKSNDNNTEESLKRDIEFRESKDTLKAISDKNKKM
jgi:hypothetical protein